MGIGIWRQGITRRRISGTALPGFITTNGALYVGPTEKVSGTFDSGVGVVIQADDVTIVNPSIRDYHTGISIRRKADNSIPKRVNIVYDPSQPSAAAGCRLFNMRQALEVQVVEGLDYGSRSRTQKMPITDCYRPSSILAGRDMELHDCAISHPTVRDWSASGLQGAITGHGVLPDIQEGALSDGTYRYENINMRRNTINDVWEECCGYDCRGNEPTKMQTRDADTVASVNAGADTVTLSSGLWAASGVNYNGYYLAFVNHAQSGKPLRIVSRSGATFTLNTSQYPSILSSVAANARVVIIAPFLNCTVEDNVVHAEVSRSGLVFHGGMYGGIMRGNEVWATSRFDYTEAGNHNQRMSTVRPGENVYNAARVSSASSLGQSSAVVDAHPPAPSEYNVVHDNIFHNGDMSYHCILYGNTVYPSRNYTPYANTFDDTTGDGAQFWNHQQVLI